MSYEQFFPGFTPRFFSTDGGVSLHTMIGGDGPPLVLLHGAPQSAIMWRHVAPRLAEQFTIIAPDLRGYGLSDKPAKGDYSKRRMAADIIAIMDELGFARFRLAGHDRGARVSRRLAKDAPERVERLAVLDIVPTAYVFANLNHKRASSFWHWFAWSLPEPFPENYMGPQAHVLIEGMKRVIGDEAAIQQYLATNAAPDAFHAMCRDYRAGASADLKHDAADADVPIACPGLVLYGANSRTTGAVFDVEAAWQGEFKEVAFEAIECGHYLPEEAPERTHAALSRFFSEKG